MKVQFMRELEREAWPERFDLSAFSRTYLRNFYKEGRKAGYPVHVARSVTGAVLMGAVIYHVQLDREMMEFVSTLPPDINGFVVALNANEMDLLTPEDRWEAEAHHHPAPEQEEVPAGFATWEDYYDQTF